MSDQTPLPDERARQQAMDPRQSFIVRAPAGSGKTELLVRRYLVLLARVPYPEAVIALTFTRKAAAEMRARVLHALEQAQETASEPCQNTCRQLAQRVLAHDGAMHWHLLAHPHRLRIQTIDSFCQTLSHQTPLLSAPNEPSSISENHEFLYRAAARELLISLEHDSPWQKALMHLLQHLDNDFNRLETLFSELLASREQWLDYLSGEPTEIRTYLEHSLNHINQVLIEQVNHCMSDTLRQELTELLDFSLQQCGTQPIQAGGERRFWQMASILLLNKDDTWRKQLTKNEGFPTHSGTNNKERNPHYTTMKQRMITLIQTLQHQPGLHPALVAIKNAPPLTYTESQWATLAALLELLPALVAHLSLIFQQHQQVDHVQILLSALAALGGTDKPSELTLHLDYQIQHLLIDEFQDTSLAQFQLIEKLTAGWHTDDGRSLFLVGDPMQSIYRFRKAEPDLFLQTQEWGIGQIQLQALTLSVNFRSNASLITWVNHCFTQLASNEMHTHHTQISFSPATTPDPPCTQQAVHSYWFHDADEAEEARYIVEIIRQIREADAQASIAILVRTRSHLWGLLSVLRRANIPYRAVEIENLSEKSLIQDLLALTRSLLHLGDRVAWLSLLHTPFCGLDLADLTEITRFKIPCPHLPTIWEQLTHFEYMELKPETKQRLRRIVPVLQQALQEQRSFSVYTWIRRTWMALGGPTTLDTPGDMALVHDFLDYLEKRMLSEGEQLDLVCLTQDLETVFIQEGARHNDQVEIITVHKAKGLEFDHVILPSLHRRGGADDAKLLLYQEQRLSNQTKGLLLAPIKANHEAEDPIYRYLSLEEKRKTQLELTRLLYVASTRAKTSLFLLGGFRFNKKQEIMAPHPDSFLYRLWPMLHLEPHEIRYAPTAPHNTEQQLSDVSQIKRLPADWQNPALPCFASKQTTSYARSPSDPWINPSPTDISALIRRLLGYISLDGLSVWDAMDMDAANIWLMPLLQQAGIADAIQDKAAQLVKTAIKNSLSDARGRWILSQEHQACYSECGFTVMKDDSLQNLIIDRSFIDQDTRWLIVYEIAAHTKPYGTASIDSSVQRHKARLETCAAAFVLDPILHGDHCAIRLGLYFPLSATWHEWEYVPTVPEPAYSS